MSVRTDVPTVMPVANGMAPPTAQFKQMGMQPSEMAMGSPAAMNEVAATIEAAQSADSDLGAGFEAAAKAEASVEEFNDAAAAAGHRGTLRKKTLKAAPPNLLGSNVRKVGLPSRWGTLNKGRQASGRFARLAALTQKKPRASGRPSARRASSATIKAAIRSLACSAGIEHRGWYNPGSAWYGDTRRLRNLAKITVALNKYGRAQMFGPGTTCR